MAPQHFGISGQAQREPKPGPQLCHGIQPVFPMVPVWESVSQWEQTGSKPPLRLHFPSVFVNSRCSRLLRVVSELHKRFYQEMDEIQE